MITVTLRGNNDPKDCFVDVAVSVPDWGVQRCYIPYREKIAGDLTFTQFKALPEVNAMHSDVCRIDVAVMLNDLSKHLYGKPYINGYIGK